MSVLMGANETARVHIASRWGGGAVGRSPRVGSRASFHPARIRIVKIQFIRSIESDISHPARPNYTTCAGRDRSSVRSTLVCSDGLAEDWPEWQGRSETRSVLHGGQLIIRLVTFMRETLSPARWLQINKSRTSLSVCGSMWPPSALRISI